VHNPHTISEFEAHGEQTLQVCGPTRGWGGGALVTGWHTHTASATLQLSWTR
jgi:hypothetical protein